MHYWLHLYVTIYGSYELLKQSGFSPTLYNICELQGFKNQNSRHECNNNNNNWEVYL